MSRIDFSIIVLLPEEEKLLRKMLDGDPRDINTPNIDELRGFELVDIVQTFPTPNNSKPYKMQYRINAPGKAYLKYVDKNAQISKRESTRFWITLVVAGTTLLFTIAALIVSIIALAKK